MITREEIFNILSAGPIKTRDLILNFKEKLKADPRNREMIKDYIKEMATIKKNGDMSLGENNVLILKPDYLIKKQKYNDK